MGVTDRYRKPADVPARLPVFPLRSVILLPRTQVPLNVFEPRYLALIDDVLAGNRLLGLIQPGPGGDVEEESPLEKNHPLRNIGCVGRLTSFTENDDGRMLITLSGVARFKVVDEETNDLPYRVCRVDLAPYADDLVNGFGENTVDREKLLALLRAYLDAHSLSADWDNIHQSSTEHLVNTLSIISPYGFEEKQALLEAPDLNTRAEILMALAEMELAAGEGGTGNTMQ